MANKPDQEKQKPGPEAERLVIEEDPATALDKLLKKPATASKDDA